MRFFTGIIGAILGLTFFSVPACRIMAYVVHGATDGKGDGSARDAVVLAAVILAPVLGFVVGAVAVRGDQS